jgi:farnesyl diphosphate synthase
MDMNAFAARLAEVGATIEAELDALLSLQARDGEPTRPQRLIAAMRYGALGGGKRLRPFLVVETARAFGCVGEGPCRVGAAIELAHAYSLIHDDLPAMDDDDLRRGRPTVHRAFDEATAILAGDALLTLGFEVMADPATAPDAEIRVALCAGLARAAGLAGMVGGQMLDIAAESASAPLGAEKIARMQAMKTGALLRFSVEAGAIVAGAPASARSALGRYGAALGAAFQIADDLLDAEGDAAALGKRAGKDASRNKATFVAALGLAGAREARPAGRGGRGGDRRLGARGGRRHLARGGGVRGREEELRGLRVRLGAAAQARVCPSPCTRYLNVHNCSTPTGPRACMRPVAMPISAPKPNSPPSANCVEALCSTIAESTSFRNRSAAAASSVTMQSVWCEP